MKSVPVNPCRPPLREVLAIERLEARELFAVFNVNTLADSTAVDLVTGVDSTGAVSLRSAIMAANSLGGTNTIVLKSPATNSERYYLSLPGRNEDSAASGDLDIRGRLIIKGNGARIAAESVDRVFDVMLGTNLTLVDLTVLTGEASEGGAIYNRGRLTLNSVTLFGTAVGNLTTPAKGGSVFNARSGTLIGNSSLIDGTAYTLDGDDGNNGLATPGQDAGSVAGGGLYNLGNVTWSNGSVSGVAHGGKGGAGGAGARGRDAGTLSATDGVSGANGGRGGSVMGGAIFNGSLATLSMTDSAVQGDAVGGLGGDGGEGGGGGNAGYVFGNSTIIGLGPGQAARGGNGGSAGNAMGGAIYNSGGTITLNRGLSNPFSIFGRAMGSLGGAGGLGGSGGEGAVHPNGESFIAGSNGADGGSGGSGGSALGGTLYSVSGTLQLNGIRVPDSGNIGVWGGDRNAGGSGGGLGILSGSSSPGNDGAWGSVGRAEGGAFWISGGSLNLTQSLITSVEARGAYSGAARGGVLALSGGSVTIAQSTLDGNSASGGAPVSPGAAGGVAYGGAIWVTNGSLTIDSSLITQSDAIGGTTGAVTLGTHGGLAGGGSLAMSGGIVSIINSTLSSNRATGGRATSPSAPGALLLNRGGNGGSAYGGAIYATGGSLTVNGSTFNDNEARSSAGAAGYLSGPNGAAGLAQGGGLYTSNATVTLDNTTVHGNSVDMLANGVQSGTARGGGIYHAGTGQLSLNYVTVARNNAGSFAGATSALGGGIVNASGPLSLRNTLIVLNTIGSLLTTSQNDVSGTITSLGYNMVGVRNNTTNFVATGDRSGSTSRPINARLGTLADNGGPTPTCSLESGSPAIDMADPIATLTTDQRGMSRLTNGRSDIGAFEVTIELLAQRRK